MFSARLRAGAVAVATVSMLAFAPVSPAQADETAQTATATASVVKHKKKNKSGKVGSFLRVARGQIGDRYSYGSAGPNAFDCSGLVLYSAQRAGIRGVPRTSGAQSGFARRVARNNMRPGDLMFFSNGGGVYHVGIFAGWRNGKRQILHASRSGVPVKVDGVWTNNWFGGTLRGK